MAKNSLDLLDSIEQPKTTWEKVFDWSFTIGRYLVIFIEAIVLGAFVVRFAIDRTRNDLDKQIERNVSLLQFREDTGDTDNLITTYYTVEQANTLLENENQYAELISDVIDVIDSRATISTLLIQDVDTVRITGTFQSLKISEQVEDDLRSAEFTTNVNMNLTTGTASSSGGVEFTAEVDFDTTAYQGIFVSKDLATNGSTGQ